MASAQQKLSKCPACQIHLQLRDVTRHYYEHHEKKHVVFTCHLCNHSEIFVELIQRHFDQCHNLPLDRNQLQRDNMKTVPNYQQLLQCPHCPFKALTSVILENHRQFYHPAA